jgi:hypothetical protein
VVSVRGTWGGTIVSNARIERRSFTSGAPTGETIRIKGVASGPLSDESFTMAGPDGKLIVHTAGAAFLRGMNAADASVVVGGASLEVEGTVQADGSLAAHKVESEKQRNVRIEGDLTAVNTSSGTLNLNGVTARAGNDTAFRDNRKTPPAIANLTLSGLAPGDHLRVDGFLDGSGQVITSQVQRFDPRPVAILQGPVSAVDIAGTELVILGVTVTVNTGVDMVKGATPFTDLATFAAEVAPGSTVVKAKGVFTGGNFSANELEIEQ